MRVLYADLRSLGPGRREAAAREATPTSSERFRASVIEMIAALGEASTAIIALFSDVSESPTHVGEHSTALGERLTPLRERRGDFILRLTDGVEGLTGIGETFTDAGQKYADRGSRFAKAGETTNAVATPPFAGGSCWGTAGFE